MEKEYFSFCLCEEQHRNPKTIGVVYVGAPTGILCTAQSGGKFCLHPEIEGFPIYLYSSNNRKEFDSALKFLDDCKWGCWGGENLDDIERAKYGAAIDIFLRDEINFNKDIYSIHPGMYLRFDWERINELMEAWWPVCMQFKRDKDDDGDYNVFKGYVHLGNCD